MLSTSLYSSFGLLGVLIGLGLFVGVIVLSVPNNRTRLQRATKLVVGSRHQRRQHVTGPAS
jgi:hypothetical protein